MGARLTGEDIWITHTAIIKQLAASTTGSEGDKTRLIYVSMSVCEMHFHVHLVYSYSRAAKWLIV